MKPSDIGKIRLASQHVSNTPFSTPEKIVSWLGAVQAQDYRMVKWAIGSRLPGGTFETIEAAIECGDILRTHLLRPTWHFVSAKDLRWLLKLTAPRVKIALRYRHKQLGLTEELVSKSNKTIKEALSKSGPLRRSELVAELEAVGFENKSNLAYHLLLHAELDGIICSGPSKGNTYTYALFEERVPEPGNFDKDEAMAKLARTYFSSRGPATLKEFCWWSGLTPTSARNAFEMIKTDFISVELNGLTYWMSDSVSIPSSSNGVYLLPAYDEFLISYKHRNAVITKEQHRKAVSANGFFRPIILVDGRVAGIWKQNLNRDTVKVEASFFSTPSEDTKKKLQTAAEKYATFWGKPLEVCVQTS